METQNQNYPFGYIVTPLPPPKSPELKQEETPSNFSVVGAFFWAILLLLAFWFVTGGYETINQ